MRASRVFFMLALSLFVLAAAGLMVQAAWTPTPVSAGTSAKDSGWLGVMLQDLDRQNRADLGIARRVEGALVTRVLPDSPAERAGIEDGDVIVEIDNRRVDSMKEAVKAARELTPGEKVLVVVNRNGTNRGLTVRPGEGDQRQMAFFDDYTVRDSDREVRKHFKAPAPPRKLRKPRVRVAPKAPRVLDEDGRKVIVIRGDDDDDRSWSWSSDDDDDRERTVTIRRHGDGDDDDRVVILRGEDDHDGRHSWSWNSDDDDHHISIHMDEDDDVEGLIEMFIGDDEDGEHRIQIFHGDDDDDEGRIWIHGDDDDDDEGRIWIHRDDDDDDEGRIWIHRDDDDDDARVRIRKRVKDDDSRFRVRSRAHGGFLGVETQGLDGQLARYFDVDEDQGVLITEIVDDSPAERAGLAAGDVIVAVDGEKVESTGDLRRIIRKHEPGKSVDVEIVRRGAQKRVKVELADISDFSDARFPAIFGDHADLFRFDGDGPLRVLELELPDFDELEVLEELESLEGLEILEGLEGLVISGLEDIHIPDLDINIPEIDIELHGLDEDEMEDLRERLHRERGRLHDLGIELHEMLGDEDGQIRIQIEEGTLQLQEHLEKMKEHLQELHRDHDELRIERKKARKARREARSAQGEALREQARAVREAQRVREEVLLEKNERRREARELIRVKEELKRKAREASEDV